jgi:BNR/Asp-box repeat
MATDDREKQFDRALARHLSKASPGSACPEAEILAAYHERTLSLEEMGRWKEHIAGCARCEESLALIEQTETILAKDWEGRPEVEPVEERASSGAAPSAMACVRGKEGPLSAAAGFIAAPTERSKGRPRLPWPWIVPLGALAAGTLVWIGVGAIRTEHRREPGSAQVAENRAPIPQPPSSEAAVRKHLEKESTPEPRIVPGPPPRKALAPPSLGAALKQGTQPPTVAGDLASAEKDLALPKQMDMHSARDGGTLAPSQTSPSASNSLARSRASNAPVSQPAAVPAQGGAAPSPVVIKEEEDKKNPTQIALESAESTTATVNNASTQFAANELRNTANLARIAQANRRYIVAPGETQAWRLGDGGKIERSTDHGKTWELQTSGVTADLTAGSATSDKICWIIGKAGTVLLTTDGGKRWELIHSPIPDDLGGIHATDATHALLWDVPNRKRFETSDGGATWARTANE